MYAQRSNQFISIDKTRQDKTRQDKTRQDKTRQDKTNLTLPLLIPIWHWRHILPSCDVTDPGEHLEHARPSPPCRSLTWKCLLAWKTETPLSIPDMKMFIGIKDQDHLVDPWHENVYWHESPRPSCRSLT